MGRQAGRRASRQALTRQGPGESRRQKSSVWPVPCTDWMWSGARGGTCPGSVWSWISGSPGRLQPAGTLKGRRPGCWRFLSRHEPCELRIGIGRVGLGWAELGWCGWVALRCAALRCVGANSPSTKRRYGRREGRIGRSLGPPHVQLRRGQDTTGQAQARIFLPQATQPSRLLQGHPDCLVKAGTARSTVLWSLRLLIGSVL